MNQRVNLQLEIGWLVQDRLWNRITLGSLHHIDNHLVHQSGALRFFQGVPQLGRILELGLDDGEAPLLLQLPERLWLLILLNRDSLAICGGCEVDAQVLW